MSDPTEPTDILTKLGGAAGALTFMWFIIQKLAGRVVAREDTDKDALMKNAQTTRETLVRLDARFARLEEHLTRIEAQQGKSAIESEKAVASVRSEFREQMETLEHRLKQDMQRAISSALPPEPPRKRRSGR